MSARATWLQHARERLLALPIGYRIAVGNALIIVVGAIGGTLITLQLAGNAAPLSLILFFASVGIGLSVIINGWIIRTGLAPLRELRSEVDRLQAGGQGPAPKLLESSDPDIRRLAQSTAALYEQLEVHNRKLRALSERVINAQEEERQRIALSLHDETGQALSSLVFTLERLELRLTETGMTDQAKAVAGARQLATDTLHELRKIIVGLRPSGLDDLGLVPAVRSYARANLEPAGVRVTVEAPDEPLPLTPRMRINLFRIAQEAVNNVARHAGATRAELRFATSDGSVCLTVRDDGRGFDVSSASRDAVASHRLGLVGMQERAALFGGDAKITSVPGSGTLIMICVPVAADSEDEG